MFFENDKLTFGILDVLELRQGKVNMFNAGRNFSAITYRLRANTILTSCGKECHLLDDYVSFIPADLDYSREAEVDELIVIHFNLMNCNAKDIEYFLPEESERMKELFIKILDLWNRKEKGYRFKCSAIFSEILYLCYLQNKKESGEESKIAGAVEYLLKNYTDPNISIGAIAERSFMSEVYFRKLFRAEYGTSPGKYIVNLRMKYAKELICAGYYSLKEIAMMCGYTDYKYFSVEFKRHVGVSPSNYTYNFGK